jgi:hypothetical protein
MKISRSKNLSILSFVIVFLFTLGADAVRLAPFSGWDALFERCPDIVVARCDRTPGYPHAAEGEEVGLKDRLVGASIDVILPIKGRTNNGPAKLLSQYYPRQGECYLIFSTYTHEYQAIEDYRVVSLGLSPNLTSLEGKKPEDQVKILLQRGRDEVDRQLKSLQEKKNHLD